MNLRSLDLNLLVILDALLDEAHVSRAADRVGLSQPAASAALQRLRGSFGDPLLERVATGMRLTPKAEALRGPLKTVLAGVRDLVEPEDMPLTEIQRTVRILSADFPSSVLVGPLIAMLEKTAPGIDLVIQPWQGGGQDLANLIAGESDLVLSMLPDGDPDIRRERLLNETYIVAARQGHRGLADFGMEAWISAPHVVVSAKGESHGPVDEALASIGKRRRVGMVVPNFQLVPAILRGSDMMALLPSRYPAAEEGLETRPPPLDFQPFDLHLGRHRRTDGDRAVLHVADCLRTILG